MNITSALQRALAAVSDTPGVPAPTHHPPAHLSSTHNPPDIFFAPPHPWHACSQTFPEYLMNSPYLTQNPDEADYFYVWVSHRVKQSAMPRG